MTADMLDALLRINITGSLAILLVVVLRETVRRHAGARVAYGMWLAVPIVVAASFLPARVEYAQVMPASAAIDGPAAPASSPIPVATALLALWLAGAIASLAWMAWRHSRFMRGLGRMTRRSDGALKAETSLLGPAVVGIVKPRIILPADFETRYDATEQRLIIAHETRHVRAGHLQFNAAMALVESLNWFNPLVYLAARLVRIDQEMACDEAVVSAHGASRKVYAEAVLKTQLAEEKLVLGCYWPSHSRHPLNQRIALLTRSTPGRVRRAVTVAGLGAVALTGAAIAWASAPPQIRAVVKTVAIAAPKPAMPAPSASPEATPSPQPVVVTPKRAKASRPKPAEAAIVAPPAPEAAPPATTATPEYSADTFVTGAIDLSNLPPGVVVTSQGNGVIHMSGRRLAPGATPPTPPDSAEQPPPR